MKKLLILFSLLAPVFPARALPAAEANNQFAMDLYQQLSSGNSVYSPISLTSALAMTGLGARGKTAEEMASTLHLSFQETHKLGQLQQQLAKNFTLVNRIWPDKRFSLLPEYSKLLQVVFSISVTPLDFAHQPEQARKKINSWIAQATHDKIPQLLTSSDISSATALVLTNAVYFKSTWVTEFNPKLTTQEIFYGSKSGPVPTMSCSSNFNYSADTQRQMLEMNYSGSNLSMCVLLPRQRDGLEAMTRQLNAKKLSQWIKEMSEAKVVVKLPRFKITDRLNLEKTLPAMGMVRAFKAGQADFSGMDGSHGLFIDKVIHQATVEVNEAGTVAAAATAVTMTRSAPKPVKTEVFRADHPFLFLIRDKSSGAIIFMGRVMQP